MSEGAIPRAVELIATVLIPRKEADLAAIRMGIVNTGGVISGPRLSGRVTTSHLIGDVNETGRLSTIANVRIRTDDHADVLMIDQGEWWGSDDALTRLLANKLVAPTEIYLVGIVRFQTADPRYTWLNDDQFFSHALGDRDQFKVSVYEAADNNTKIP
jgi:hypothetical protein